MRLLPFCRSLQKLPFRRIEKTFPCPLKLLPSIACQNLASQARMLFQQPQCVWPADLPTAAEWGYNRKGPATWPEKYPPAGGEHQSPVDIVVSSAVGRSFERPLTWRYGEGVAKSIVNTGCGWRVDAHGADSELTGGPLSDTYELVQFHCHWGKESNGGSEHTVDGTPYAGELHFVHWNKDKFSSCAEAVMSHGGLTVIAVFLEVGDSNSEMEKLCEVIPKIVLKDERISLQTDVSPMEMFPDEHQFWTYSGSLTTPPCYESVTWIVFKKPVTVSEEQLECFRHMKKACADGGHSDCVEHNFRPPQAVNDRQIFESA